MGIRSLPPAATVEAQPLTRLVDVWTVQAVAACGYLVRLYRALGDDRQASVALRACGPSEERAQRSGLQAQVAASTAEFAAGQADDTVGEQNAWELLVEAQAGLCAFHAMVDDHEKGGSLRGLRTNTNKAFEKALLGYRVAFPEEMTVVGIGRAVATAADRCSDSFSLNLADATDEEKSTLRREIHASILEGLMDQVLAGEG